MKKPLISLLLAACCTTMLPLSSRAEDGHRLWLPAHKSHTTVRVEANAQSPTIDLARTELSHHFLGTKAVLHLDPSMADEVAFIEKMIKPME